MKNTGCVSSSYVDRAEDSTHKEAVNHPDHYGGADNPYEVIKVVLAWNLPFTLGNTVKYVARAGKKDPAKHIEDLEKARFYLDKEIEELKKAQSK